MKVSLKMRIISLIMCFLVVSTLFSSITVNASVSFSVVYAGTTVSNGGSIHYTSTPVTIGISVSETSGFYAEFSGTTGGVTCTTPDGTTYKEYELNSPSGAVDIIVTGNDTTTSTQTINFYHDTVLNPDATLSYVSVKAHINKINYTKLSESDEFEVDYNGYDNSGVDTKQVSDKVNTLKSKVGISESGEYKVEGYLYVEIFTDSDSAGIYNTYTKQKISGSGLDRIDDYNWGTALLQEIEQRASWGQIVAITLFL